MKSAWLAFLIVVTVGMLVASCKNPKTDEAICGNGVLDLGEACDPAISSGEGVCPVSCDDGNACTAGTLVGNAADCTATCEKIAITACRSGDGCCPAGCTYANDDDCPVTCAYITTCQSGDGCCPVGCTYTNDHDCPTYCNNLHPLDSAGVAQCMTSIANNCGNQEVSCYGSNWTSGQISGGTCEAFLNCITACAPTYSSSCFNTCVTNDNNGCVACASALGSCEKQYVGSDCCGGTLTSCTGNCCQLLSDCCSQMSTGAKQMCQLEETGMSDADCGSLLASFQEGRLCY